MFREKRIEVEESSVNKEIRVNLINPNFLVQNFNGNVMVTFWMNDGEADRLSFHIGSVLQDKERRIEKQETPAMEWAI